MICFYYDILFMKKYFIFCLVVVASLLQSRVAAATHYVLLNSGNLRVFPDSCLQQWESQDDKLVFTALDGSQYCYPMADVVFCGEESPRELPVITSFKINNKYNYQVITDATATIEGDVITVQVLGIGKRLTPSFSIGGGAEGLVPEAWVNGVKQVSKESRLRFDGDVTYLVGYSGDKILAPRVNNTFGMEQFGRSYTVKVLFLTDQATAVPRIDINTVNGEPISSKEYYLDAEIIIDGAGIFPSMTDSVKVKGRGNSTWSSNPDAKNPYRLKFASKRKPLGLKNAKSWVLLANKSRGSMMTNPIGMLIAYLLDLPFPNHMIPVDLYVNGVCKGSYTFTEKVGFSNNSIDLEHEEVAALIEMERNFDEAITQMYPSPGYYLPIMVQEPEFGVDESFVTLDIVKQRFNAFESAVKNGGDLAPHVDVESLARYMLMNEYILNREILWPKSTYFYHTDMLSDTGRFVFGPAWDMDYGFGFGTGGNYFAVSTSEDFYQTSINSSGKRFFTDIHNRTDVGRQVYKAFKAFMGEKLDELCEFCQDYYEYAAPSFEHNAEVWSEETFNYSYQAYTEAPQWLRSRAQKLLLQLAALYCVAGDVNGNCEVDMDDLTLLINYLLTNDSTGMDLLAADVSGDGHVTMDDLTDLINYLLTGSASLD